MAKRRTWLGAYRPRPGAYLSNRGGMIYLTRDKDEDGKLDDMIDVWSVEPYRVTQANGAVIWQSGGGDFTLMKVLYVDDAKKAFGIAPTVAREMIVLPRKRKERVN